MSDANNQKHAEMQQQERGSQEQSKKSESKLPWFNYMKKDELAPEETREIAFLGYN